MDKISKKLIEYLSTCDKYAHLYPNKFPEHIGNDSEIKAALRYLSDKGLIGIVTTDSGYEVGVQLKHVGIHYKEFARMEFYSYIKDKWVDIAALSISVLAFIGAYRKELVSIIRAIIK
jgi:hypothetical protein